MSYLKFAPELFLEVVELNRSASFLDQDGFRKFMLNDAVNFGLIKTKKDNLFSNGRVERDLDTTLGQKTIKIRALEAISKSGLFLVSEEVNNIPTPADGRWYWVKVKHKYSSKEKGIVSLSVNGDMIGVGTKFTETLRGAPNFQSRISFLNSQHNTLEYDVLEVIDDEHATVMHPAVTGTGVATFEIEDDLQYSVVGTFTPGIAINPALKFPFQYDSIQYELIPEEENNIRPTFIEGEEFYIARIKVIDQDIVIQDKRTEFFDLKGSQLHKDIETKENPLVGVEFIKWQNKLSPSTENEVFIAWGMRTQNWNVDSSKNIVTFHGSALGGKYKSISQFNDGDFNGWRLYNGNGTHSIITSSVKQGQSINLTLDTLDVDNFSDNGGLTFRNQGDTADWIIAVPNAEEIEFFCHAGAESVNDNTDRTFVFAISDLIGRCDLEVYQNPTAMFHISYRYKTGKTYSATYTLPEDEIGYFDETSFTSDGNLLSDPDRVRYPYVPHPINGYIKLIIDPTSYSILIDQIYKGDRIGVNTVVNLGDSQTFELQVRRDKRYQHIVNDLTLTDDLFIALSDVDAKEGNEFRVHFDCKTVNLNGKKIQIIHSYSGGSPVTIKTLEQGDFYQMFNQDGGIIFTCVFSDLNKWTVVSQNYDLGTPYEVKMIDGDISQMFTSGGLGKVKGLFGYAVCNGNNGTPNLADRFVLGTGTQGGVTRTWKDTGGANTAVVTGVNLPKHSHKIGGRKADRNTSGGGYEVNQVHLGGYDPNNSGQSETSWEGGNDNPTPLNLKNPYYAMIFAKKLY